MSAKGYIHLRAYTSKAQIPLADVAVTVTTPENTVLSMGLTDRSGTLKPITLDVPDLAESQTPDPASTPYITVNLYARKGAYEPIEIRGLQVFAQTVTIQNLEMIPLTEFPESRNATEIFRTPAQNL